LLERQVTQADSLRSNIEFGWQQSWHWVWKAIGLAHWAVSVQIEDPKLRLWLVDDVVHAASMLALHGQFLANQRDELHAIGGRRAA
jgi:hypothetical protein